MKLLLLAAAVVAFAYPFVLYPLILAVLVRRSRQVPGKAEPPEVTFVICAFNEERMIREKIANSLALDYPAGRLHIVVVSDGSTDSTAAIAAEFGPGIRLIAHAGRRGKVTCLNETVAGLETEIVAFSDANVLYHPQALRHLVRGFEEPQVGAVSGKVVLKGTAETIRQSEGHYYSLEWELQEKESSLYSMAGVDGAMHALRRSLFRACPPDTLIEDFVLAIAVVRQGFRVVFEPEALAWETGPASVREEYRRRVRIAAGAAQCLLRGNGWPLGAPARFWFVFVSHKLLRWLSPLAALAALGLALASLDTPAGVWIAGGAALVALLAAVRLLTGWSHPLVNAPFYFLFGQAALLAGLWKGATGGQSVLWAKADR